MADQLLDSMRRWFEVIEGQAIDPDYFTQSEVWEHAQVVLTMADQHQHLPEVAVTMLGEISVRLGMSVGSSPETMGAMWEQNFGGCPYGTTGLTKLTAYLRGQISAFRGPMAKRGPDISAEEKKPDEPVVWPEKKLW